MYRYYFPKCPIDGPLEPPVPFSHGCSNGAIPNKCSKCDFSFEGSCLRYYDDVGRYLHLDCGPCGIQGSTEPVLFEGNNLKLKLEIPKKCADCRHLNVDKPSVLTCTKDMEKWGDFERGLDWGAWQPVSVYIELPSPKSTTIHLVEYARNNDLTSFVKEYRRCNPDLFLSDAKVDFLFIREKLDKFK